MFAALVLALSSQPLTNRVVDDPLETSCYAKVRSSKDVESCGIQALARAEQEMDFFWGNTLAEYRNGNPQSMQLLKNAQAEWLVYRKSWCDVVAHDNHGSNPSTNAGCQAKLTRQRTQTIKELIEGTNE